MPGIGLVARNMIKKEKNKVPSSGFHSSGSNKFTSPCLETYRIAVNKLITASGRWLQKISQGQVSLLWILRSVKASPEEMMRELRHEG